MFTFQAVPLPPSDLLTPSDELERLLIELIASENQRLAAATPDDGKRLSLHRDTHRAGRGGEKREGKEGATGVQEEGTVAANRRAHS